MNLSQMKAVHVVYFKTSEKFKQEFNKEPQSDFFMCGCEERRGGKNKII